MMARSRLTRTRALLRTDILRRQTAMRPAVADGKVIYFDPPAYWMTRTRQDQLASLYPVVTPLLVAPLYVPAVIWLNAHGWEQPQIDRMAEVMEKLSASFLASVASVLMYLVLRRDGSRWSLPLALAFAFGTNTWMISSQALWQHGTGELLIALALLLVLAPASPVRTVAPWCGVCFDGSESPARRAGRRCVRILHCMEPQTQRSVASRRQRCPAGGAAVL